jgi:hypothetical protein
MSAFTASDANQVERLGGTLTGGGSGSPTGPAGGGLAGTYPNPTIAAGAVTEAGLSLSNVATANVTSTAHGFAPRSPADAAQFLNGAATPAYAVITDAQVSNSPTNKLTTTGDLLYASSANTLARLGIGATGQVLTVVGGVPAWAYPPGFQWGYDQTTSTVNVVSTTEATPTTIFTCAAHTFDGAPVWVEMGGALRTASSAGGQIVAMLFESTTEIIRLASSQPQSASQQMTTSLVFGAMFTPTAGSHTYILAAFVAGTTGTPFIAGGPGGAAANPPTYLRFTKV